MISGFAARLARIEVPDHSCPYRLAISVFVSIFQSLILFSNDPLARIVPILLKTTEVTGFSCPFNIAISLSVSMSQSAIVL